MPLLAHISDLHFGAHEPHIVAALLDDLAQQKPHLVVVTGDLTQRARARQFQAAREFLDRLDAPRLVIPGNHDIPLYNFTARFFWPLQNYTRYISENVEPTFADNDLAVAGVNTARSNRHSEGRVSVEDIERLRVFFAAQPPSAVKILAAHHPFAPPQCEPNATLVGRAKRALRMLADCGCHIILTGHLHHTDAGDTRPHHVEIEQSILVIQAGTATSHRRRNEPNGYNLLHIEPNVLRLEVRTHHGAHFVPQSQTTYAYAANGWHITSPSLEGRGPTEHGHPR